MADEKKTELVPVRYTKAEDYKVIYVNGVYGGMTGKGEIRFDLFQEFTHSPEDENLVIDEMGTIVGHEALESDKQIEMTRERMVGIVMTLGTARAFQGWFAEHLQRFEERLAERERMLFSEEGEDSDEPTGNE